MQVRTALGPFSLLVLAACGSAAQGSRDDRELRLSMQQGSPASAAPEASSLLDTARPPSEHAEEAAAEPYPSSNGGTGADDVASDVGQGEGGASGGDVETECSYPNYPNTEWSPDAWVPYAAVAQVGASGVVDAVRESMVGRWHGLVHTPWTTPYEVDLTFTADGHYSGACSDLSPRCCLSFYYGTDDDTPLKQYRITDATVLGNVFGEIDVPFAYDAEYGLPSWQGELFDIQRDASGDGLRFAFRTSSGYGDVEYDLRRVSEEPPSPLQ